MRLCPPRWRVEAEAVSTRVGRQEDEAEDEAEAVSTQVEDGG